MEGGDESDLRTTVRGLMAGPEFHEFLMRGSNDRLLTDRRTRGSPQQHQPCRLYQRGLPPQALAVFQGLSNGTNILDSGTCT